MPGRSGHCMVPPGLDLQPEKILVVFMKPCLLESLIEFVVVQLVKDSGWGGEGKGGECL